MRKHISYTKIYVAWNFFLEESWVRTLPSGVHAPNLDWHWKPEGAHQRPSLRGPP